MQKGPRKRNFYMRESIKVPKKGKLLDFSGKYGWVMIKMLIKTLTTVRQIPFWGQVNDCYGDDPGCC
jgi:hypothetical protein